MAIKLPKQLPKKNTTEVNWLKDVSDIANTLGSGGLRPGVGRLYKQYKGARRTSMRASLEPPISRYRDKYDEQKIEADHYAKYLARLTLNRYRRGLSLQKFRQGYWNPNRQSYRFRDPVDDVNYNPLTGDFRQARAWRPGWFIEKYLPRLAYQQDPLYFRRPFQMGPFRNPEDQRKEAYERFIPKQIRRTIGDPRQPEDRDINKHPRSYYYVPSYLSIETAFPFRKKSRKHRKTKYWNYPRQKNDSQWTYHPRRYSNRLGQSFGSRPTYYRRNYRRRTRIQWY